MSIQFPEHGTGERRRLRAAREGAEERARRIRSVGIVLAVVALTTAVPLLGYIGFHQVLESTGGRKIDAVNDPTKPGYEANVEPTPVEVVAQVGSDGTLASLTLLALGRGDAGGSIVFLPVATAVASTAGQPTTAGLPTPTLADAFTTGGIAALQRAVTTLLGFGFDELTTVDDARWTALTGAVAPIAFTNPDRIRTPSFPAGPIELDADRVGPYLAARNANESDLARLSRQGVFWSAWLQAIAKSTRPDVLPGEAGTGLDHFLQTLAKGNVVTDTLPVTAVGDHDAESFVPKPAEDTALLSTAVPFPTGTVDHPRIKVRLLDGVGDEQLVGRAADLVVPAGAEVDIIGNGDHFGYDTTVVRYNADEDASAAQQLRDAIGMGTVVQGQELDDAAQVTIVLGRDFAARYGSVTNGSAPSSGSPASSSSASN